MRVCTRQINVGLDMKRRGTAKRRQLETQEETAEWLETERRN